MKKKLYIATTIFVTMTACTNDLDVEPLDPTVSTANRVYADAANYQKALDKIYSVWALSGQDGAGGSDISDLDAGNTVLFRSWFTLQEQTTDEMKNSWSDPWCLDVNGILWSTTKCEPIEGVYQRCMFIVALANEYLKNIPNAPKEVDKSRFAAEARFCRALAYYTLLDLFGIPPFITEENYSMNPSPLSREELFAWIENELLSIQSALPVARHGGYGRADQAVVDALLARMYLNAAVYTGTERYTDCVAACNRVISAGYSLADNYAELFMADNGQNARANREIIYPVIFDGNTTQSYGMAAVILGSRSSSDFADVPAGIGGGWDGFRGTPQLVRMFDYQDNANPKANEILDKRGIFYDKNRSIDITTSVTGTFTTEGWSVYKYTNIRSDGQPGSNTTFPDTDFPMFRLADIYLMYAEACAAVQGANYKSGSYGKTAVEAINILRERVGAAPVADKFTADSKKFMDEVRRERACELAFEGFRWNDLQRWLLLTEYPYNIKTSQEFRRVGDFDFAKNDPRDAEVTGWREEIIVERVFSTQHYLFPFHNDDVYLYAEFGQNPGW